MIIYVVTELDISECNGAETYSRVFKKLDSARNYLNQQADSCIKYDKNKTNCAKKIK